MKSFTLFVVMNLLLAAGAARGQFIFINLSYKVVLNPADGTPPPGVANAANQIDQAISNANALLDATRRGYRLRRVDPVDTVGGMGDTTGPSRWYAVNFFDRDNGGTWKDQMEAQARSNPALYRWNPNAINLYLTFGICGGTCSFPHLGDSILVIGGCSVNNGPLQLHEIGHYFKLYHTQGAFCGGCGTDSGLCNTPGDDEIADTLPDLPCWDQDQIATMNFGIPYASLDPTRRIQVDDVFFNVMSYHGGLARFTELQMDRWADAATEWRLGVVSGRTRFVDGACGTLFPSGSSWCEAFAGPFASVRAGVNAANAGDIVLVRPGNYQEPQTISRPVTLRATRQGIVTIGR